MVLVVVQPVNHRRVGGEFHEQFLVVAHAPFAEHLNLGQHLVAVVQLGVAGGEHMVPEQSHLFFQGLVGADHVVEPVSLAHYRIAAGEQTAGVIAKQEFCLAAVPVRGGIYQFFHNRVVALGDKRFQLFPVGAESGTPHQVSH